MLVAPFIYLCIFLNLKILQAYVQGDGNSWTPLLLSEAEHLSTTEFQIFPPSPTEFLILDVGLNIFESRYVRTREMHLKE